MTPRERVLAALNHQTPDRVPIDIGGSSVSTIIGRAYERLKACLGVEGETQYYKKKSRSARLDERIAQRLHADTRGLIVGSPDGWQDIFFDENSFQDEFGVVWRRAEGGHFAPVGNPLVHASPQDLRTFSFPDPLNPGRTRGLREQARLLHEETDYAVVLTLPVGCVHLSQYLRGYEQFLVDTAIDAGFAEALLERTAEWWMETVAATLRAVEPYVDVVVWGDDVAFQDRLMIRAEQYRRLIKPRHARMNECIKRNSRAKIVYHCDGAVRPLLQDFVEAGVDALNPVQPDAAGIHTAALKAEFGDRLAFWGGIDTHRVLPFGSPAEVREEVRRRIADLGAGGGYVVASVHNMQEDVPPENILAMADAAFEFGMGNP